jgi:hypothetical protein
VKLEPNDTIYRFRSFSSDSGETSFGGSTKARIKVLRRSRASAKFSCCNRVLSDRITRKPSFVIFVLC